MYRSLHSAEDGSSSAIGRYVNHNLRKENCYIWADDDDAGRPAGVCYIVTSKRVRAGSEFFMSECYHGI